MFFRETVESIFLEVLAPLASITMSSYTEDKKKGRVRFWLSWDGKLDFEDLTNFLGRVGSFLISEWKVRTVQKPFRHLDFIFTGVRFSTS